MALDIAFPPIPDAPHWRATTPNELGDIFGTTFPPGAFDLLPGWDLAFFTAAPQHRGTAAPREADRCTQIGWVKGSFAATQFPIDPQVHQQIGGLVHLPTGYRVASFYNAEEAATAAELIADCCDWSTITPDTVGRVGQDAMGRLADGGFQWMALETGDVTTRILSRILTVAH